MRQFRTLITCTALVALTFMLASCGDDTEAVEPVKWPFLESTQKLSINGKEFDAYVATTELHRRRAVNGIAIKEGQAIAYLYPEQKESVKINFFNLPAAVDLVFVDAAAKVVSVESVPAFSQSAFPHEYAAKDARVVLQLRKGVAKDLGLSKGSAVKTEPNLVDQSKEAGGMFAKMFFLRNERPEEKPEDAPSVELLVLEKPEQVAQFVKDRDDLKEGQGVIIPLNTQYHEFWLKEAKGKWCACYLESTGRFRATVISSIYEGIEANGGSDLDEPVYYSPTKATHLAIWKGSDYFTKNDIDRRSPVAVTALDVMSAEEVSYEDIEIKVGEERLEASLARTEDERKAALLKAKTLEKGKAIVMVWDDPSFVKIDAPAGINLWYVKAEGGKYSIGQKFSNTQAGDIGAKANSRFVIAVPVGFEASGDLTFPYVLRDLKPEAQPLIFYKAKNKDVVTDRWPGKDNEFKGRVRMELAITEAEQTRGLMYRTSLRPNYGMLFVYPEEEPELEYWMKNCKMNLSIAFCDDKGVIVKIHQVMKAPEPGTPDYQLERYEAGAPAKYAIELEEKWFEKNKVEEGDRIFIPPALANRE
ncbi:MAG: DUF192 domain-containing protein [Planctomycetes bacterium]|nr:DUF192 domain-containing protein [Planctomycetota bacterium]